MDTLQSICIKSSTLQTLLTGNGFVFVAPFRLRKVVNEIAIILSIDFGEYSVSVAHTNGNTLKPTRRYTNFETAASEVMALVAQYKLLR